MMFYEIRRGLIAMLFFTIILGVFYPLLMTGIGLVVAKDQAQGSLVKYEGQVIGSSLIGQNFADNLFQSRPSANNYDGLASGGMSMALNNSNLLKNVQTRIENLQQKYGHSKIPADLVFSSGSGLDPDISLMAAKYQAPYIAKVNHLSVAKVLQLIDDNTAHHLFNPATVNVLKLNMGLMKLVGYSR
ncbi:potassium-transporting ATPase subunit KdpC [Cysteiniphilum sp. JM-1]|uniref:potassium-transporting ATPase subunit KdpC n=1 Tax=Cysteiniphilum sp. JM-1 TaxID=2610891 RepID=UPI001CD056C5|nr:potassium-transporting ATPase subunit KdpC [Cysteiniphilum sp. JM-1]